MIVCHCEVVRDSDIRACVRAGACSLEEVSGACGAASRCGGCSALVQIIVSEEQRRSRSTRAPAASPERASDTFQSLVE